MMDLFTDPDEFFTQKARSGRLGAPTLLVLLASIAYALQSLGVFLAVENGIRINSALTVAAIFYVLEPFALWVIFSIAFYILTRPFTSRLQFGRLFRLMGWGFAPLVITGLVWTVSRYLAFQGIPVPDLVQQGVLESEQEGYRQMVAQVQGEPALVGGILVGSLFVFACAYLWAYAIEYSGDLDLRQALIASFVPSLVYVIWNVYTVL